MAPYRTLVLKSTDSFVTAEQSCGFEVYAAIRRPRAVQHLRYPRVSRLQDETRHSVQHITDYTSSWQLQRTYTDLFHKLFFKKPQKIINTLVPWLPMR